jgi:hypothetical protein
MSENATEYVKQLSPKEKKAYEIAKSHLLSSFDLEKSIGFKQYMSKKNAQK